MDTLTRPRRPISLQAISGARDLEPRFKRLLDLVLSVTGLIVSLPACIAIAIAILLEDGRPILFRQVRIGRYGRPIQLMKFRSMLKDHAQTELQARQDDPRITRVGRILRRFSLDELPQLWNILRGDMSFVGPRAQPEREIVRLKGQVREVVIPTVPGFVMRQQVRPGLTGIAQIFAPRDVPHAHKFRYDLVYVRRLLRNAAVRRADLPQASFTRVVKFLGDDLSILWLDLSLVARSVWMALRGRWQV